MAKTESIIVLRRRTSILLKVSPAVCKGVPDWVIEFRDNQF